jgi:hypothetical protein
VRRIDACDLRRAPDKSEAARSNDAMTIHDSS